MAGRRLAQAEAAAAAINAEARCVDIGDRKSWSAAFDGVDVVVMCIDQANANLVAYL